MADTIRQRLARNEIALVMGVGQLMHHNLLQMVGLNGGFHGLWFDMEHSGMSHRELEIATLAARSQGLDCFARVAPTGDKPGRSKDQTRAVVLIHGLNLFSGRQERIGKVALRVWQEPGSDLVKELARDADVYALAYTQTAPVEKIYEGARLRDRIHDLVTRSKDAGARVAAGGSYEDLFYRPTVLAESGYDHPAFSDEVFGPVAPVARFSTVEEAVALATQSEYGLSLGILTKDVMKAWDLAGQIPSGIVHINDQTVDDEPTAPFGGVGFSGTGTRFGGIEANVEAFTETQWVTMQGSITPYPF